MNLLPKQKQIHRLQEGAYGCQGREGGDGEGWGEGIFRELGMDMCILLHLKWIVNKDLQYSTWNSAQCYVAAWMGGEFGGEWIHVYAWLNPLTAHLSQYCLFISYTSNHNKDFKKRETLGAYTQIKDLLKRWQEWSHLQAKERGLRGNQPFQHLDLGLLACRTERLLLPVV